MAPGHGGFVLAVDLGSSGLKVGLVSSTGEVVGWTHHPLDTERGPGGAVTQDAHTWWRLVTESVRWCLARTAVPAREVVAVGVTGQWASTVPVDVDGLPVGPCVMWSDTRGAPYSREVVGGHVQGYRATALAAWVRRTAGVPSPSGADPVGHMLHLQHDEPGTARAARWFLEPVDYLSMRFTGRAAATPASMTAAWLTDNRGATPGYDRQLLARSGVDPDRLPPLLPTGSVIGRVRPDVAGSLGLGSGTVVVAGIPDLHASVVGSGFVRDHEAHLSIGTTAWVSCPLPAKKTDVLHQMATVPGLRPGGYLLGNNQESAGRCLEWFLAAGGGGVPDGYDGLLRLAATAPPGSGGVLFTPWLAGERSPVEDRTLRGGFHNLSLSTTPADLARAVLEGVAYNARWLLEAADRFAGRRLEPLRLVGGGARSLLWSGIVADVCDRPVERVAEPLLAVLRGAGLFAGVAVGSLGWDDVAALVPVDGVLRPRPENRDVLDALFAELPGLYRRQRRMHARLNRPAG
ncbi:xylulokinase [Nocardioides mesophilus]|uniref:FGGY-family carbohydrate kinase n=1 Tax=Nocardioides mesophilus TaxID=433659 RepID=A0A7G9REW7_9ACTN|nr:FGGY-family carbohydrate kinase [Nocardioides mesophilus]QNN54142.1 FGGY-family carbohydrate kinase [Nocardioides mesophilus]